MKKLIIFLIFCLFLTSCSNIKVSANTPENLIKLFIYENINNKQYTFEKLIDTNYIKEKIKDFFNDKNVDNYKISETNSVYENKKIFQIENIENKKIFLEVYEINSELYGISFIYNNIINNTLENTFTMLINSIKNKDIKLLKRLDAIEDNDKFEFLSNLSEYKLEIDERQDLSYIDLINNDKHLAHIKLKNNNNLFTIYLFSIYRF